MCARLLAAAHVALTAGCVAEQQSPPSQQRAAQHAASTEPRAATRTAPLVERFARHDVVIDGTVEASFARSGVAPSVIDALDAVFLPRVDIFAHLVDGATISVWTRVADGVLVGASVPLKGSTRLNAARYQGPLAPAGFYDAGGNALVSSIRARPVSLRRITSRFGERFDALSGKRALHRGIDYGVPIGTPVRAVARGRVTHVGHSASAGKFIKLEHVGGFDSAYLHLDAFDATVTKGAVVVEGQVIGKSGNTGRSTGPHLHYELRLAGIPVDPTSTLPMPSVSLGPLARQEHLAFLKQLEAMR